MKNLLIIFIICSFFNLGLHAQAEKTIVKSVDLKGNVAVAALFTENATISEWDKDFVRITVKINLSNASESILDRLVLVGRYEILALAEDGEMKLFMPKVDTKVFLKGVELDERFSYEIFVPKKVSIRLDALSVVGI